VIEKFINRGLEEFYGLTPNSLKMSSYAYYIMVYVTNELGLNDIDLHRMEGLLYGTHRI